jgi:hypothetical protein
MEPILIPSVPREAFNKHRLISDLVKKQVEHFKHIEEKLPQDVRAKIPQDAVATEAEAARYISAMTSYLLSRPRPKQVTKKVVAIKPPTPQLPTPSIALAAAAAPAPKKSATKKKLPAKKKSAPKKETLAAKKPPSIKAKAKKYSSKRKK